MQDRTYFERLEMVQPIFAAGWDVLNPEQQEKLARDLLLDAARSNPDVSMYDESTLDWEAVREAEIDGLRLAEDEDGNPLPPMVCLRGSLLAKRVVV